jgi:putative ABC transport system ATP-binding protein
VFQFYNLIPSLTVRENVELVTDIATHPMPALEALGLVGLADRVLYLGEGQVQRMEVNDHKLKPSELAW